MSLQTITFTKKNAVLNIFINEMRLRNKSIHKIVSRPNQNSFASQILIAKHSLRNNELSII